MATSSLVGVALLAPEGFEPAQAACTATITGVSAGYTNSGTIDCILVTGANVTGNIENNGDLTSPTIGISIVDSTINGYVGDQGSELGGITVDGASEITGNGGIFSNANTFLGGISNGGVISVQQSGIFLDALSTFSGGITNTGTISSSQNVGIEVINYASFLGGITNGGTLQAHRSGIELSVLTFTGNINNTGKISSTSGYGVYINGGIVEGAIVNSGSISGKSAAVYLQNVPTFSGGVTNTGAITGTYGIYLANTPGVSVFNSGTITGFTTAIQFAAGPNTLTLGPGSTINGNVVGSGSDIFQLGGSGTGAFNLSTIGSTQQYQGFTTFNVVSGTWVTTGTFGQTQAWNVDGGTLAGTGSFQSINVNNGGTLQPGTPGVAGGKLTVSGSLVFSTAATYLVNISPNAASSVSVTGQASLNGTIVLNGTGGTYKAGTTFDVLSATGGISGTFSNVVITGNFGSTRPEVTYDDIMITLVPATLTGLLPPEAPLNVINVAGGIDNFTSSGSTLPPGFQNLFNLPSSQLVSSLTQLDGEDATGAERGAFELMNEFLGLMVDPFVYGRDGGGMPIGAAGTLGFAPDQQASLPPDIALAYADALKAPPTFVQRWTTWASGFGGSGTTNGDPTTGSNNVTTSTYGYAAGMDYHYSPDTVLGFAFAGGGTNWNLAQGLGTGRSDAFQAGLYGVTHSGPAYLAAALAFANNWFTTNRTAFAGDQLTANFQGQSYGARLEGGYRFAVPYSQGAAGMTPYAAVQAQDFQTPSYSETDPMGGGFGLSYNARNGTDTRSELGSRFDDLTVLNDMPVMLRAKVAWAHDWVSNPALNASFESLPGTAFTVNGAPIPHDSALTSVGAQMWFTPNWSFLAKFDGEFASGSQTYAGSGTLRYSW